MKFKIFVKPGVKQVIADYLVTVKSYTTWTDKIFDILSKQAQNTAVTWIAGKSQINLESLPAILRQTKDASIQEKIKQIMTTGMITFDPEILSKNDIIHDEKYMVENCDTCIIKFGSFTTELLEKANKIANHINSELGVPQFKSFEEFIQLEVDIQITELYTSCVKALLESERPKVEKDEESPSDGSH